MTEDINERVSSVIVYCAEKMCVGEINEINYKLDCVDAYLKLIKDKTAYFMGICCKVGAMLSCDDNNTINSLEQFGLNFGIAYQILDDYKDNDVLCAFDLDNIEKAKEYVGYAKESIKYLKSLKYKKSFQDLTDFLLIK